jgi:hypothetical protein
MRPPPLIQTPYGVFAWAADQLGTEPMRWLPFCVDDRVMPGWILGVRR